MDRTPANLQQVFTRIRKAGLTIHPSKCCLGYPSLDFVGHTVGSDRIAMEEEKLDRTQDAPAPETKRKV